ncbi:GNAT family N-acetyltransferase [Maritimibacter sp. UBA3975]|uniref:GNAT family N-acetyltransferase n=1 Tax=Maritimibacter sp. UBA3975 TaxID=1946833 RepID=UPI0025B9FA78|nr:GNAT family N-acetyltransferase [Maritimibacter sp. UBA3975]|tara:strand:- start:3636 stop:4166 length:531 start_codon:yes stop_codon:yes gene_type:complete
MTGAAQPLGARDDLVTPRLTIRRQTLADTAALHALMSDWALVRNTGRWPYPVTRDFVAQRIVERDTQPGLYGIARREGRVIGTAQAADGEIGYLIAQAEWGQGYATEAARALVAYGFDTLGWPEVRAKVWADNPASSRVLIKLGFREAELFTDHNMARGQDLPSILYLLPKRDWEG